MYFLILIYLIGARFITIFFIFSILIIINLKFEFEWSAILNYSLDT